MKRYIRVFAIFCFFSIYSIYFPGLESMAAPDPIAVEERKAEALVHLIGTVTSDVLFKDITKEENYPLQVRKMTIEVNQMIKAPETEKENTNFEVYYTYIPAWNAYEYTGGARVDIAKGDVIEIWLAVGDYGWEPALTGNTIEHIKYTDVRNEPIQEPFIHAAKRVSSVYIKKYTEVMVLFFLFLILAYIVMKGIRK